MRTRACPLPAFMASVDADSCADQPPYGASGYPGSYPNASSYAQDAPETASPNPLRHPANYTRTLVGPLSANACRLLDEHRKEGIFFLFQDLSVRTEGVSNTQGLSCLQYVDNIETHIRHIPIAHAAHQRRSVRYLVLQSRRPPLIQELHRPPAPESGAVRVHNNVSPVLSQTFTDSFTVYSAKRFPGVPGKHLHCPNQGAS